MIRARLALTCALACLELACPAAPSVAAPIVFVPRTSTWNYFAGPAQPDTAWQARDFDDSGWASGPGPLGYGESYIATPVPYGGDPVNRWITTYFRRKFYLGEDPSAIGTLMLGLDYDDGVVVYVNGVEVLRRSLPAGPVSWSTLAFNHEANNTYEQIDLSAAVPQLVANDSNTVAVELHQTAATSGDLVFDLELQDTGPPPLVVSRGPYVQNGAPGAMTVRWRTNLATPSRVWYGPAPDQLDEVADDATSTTQHEVRITGLPVGSEWHYAVGDFTQELAGGDDSTAFHTNPAPGDSSPIRAWVIGDAGWGTIDQRTVRTAYEQYAGARRTDLWLMLGDNAYLSGLDSEFQNGVFGMYRGMLRKSCLWPTRGNHDLVYSGANNDYYDFFTMPTAAEGGGVASGSEAYYSFDYGNVHFICLDSEGTAPALDGAMVGWLRQDLAANSAMWTVAYWHHPPYTHGSHNSDDDADSFGKMGAMRRNILPILDSTGVDLVLSGHSHSYERSFLLNGHYGVSSTLTPAMILDSGRGRGIDGPYRKPSPGSAPFEGAVYVVDGSSGNTSGGTLDHPVMVESFNLLGSLVLDFHGTRLDAHFVDNQGAALDSFTILKAAAALSVPHPGLRRPPLSLALHSRNPGRGPAALEFTLPGDGPARLEIMDAAGRRIALLASGSLAAGRHTAAWDGRASRGGTPLSGVYFAVLEQSGERRVVKLTVTR